MIPIEQQSRGGEVHLPTLLLLSRPRKCCSNPKQLLDLGSLSWKYSAKSCRRRAKVGFSKWSILKITLLAMKLHNLLLILLKPYIGCARCRSWSSHGDRYDVIRLQLSGCFDSGVQGKERTRGISPRPSVSTNSPNSYLRFKRTGLRQSLVLLNDTNPHSKPTTLPVYGNQPFHRNFSGLRIYPMIACLINVLTTTLHHRGLGQPWPNQFPQWSLLMAKLRRWLKL